MTETAEANGGAERLWTLRMLSGVHAGAEAVLSDNEDATIGSNDECDLVLEDASLCARHVCVSISEAGVRLDVLDPDKPVFVDGRKVEGSVGLQPYEVVALGLSSFALGPADREWPHIAIPDVHQIEEDAPAESPQADSQERASANGQPGGVDAEAAGVDAEAGGAKVAKPVVLRFASRLPRHPAVLAGLAVTVSALAFWLLMPEPIQQHGRGPAEAAEQIRAIAESYGAIVEVRSNPADSARISVTGSIDTSQNRQRFLHDLARTGIQATAQITASEDLARFVLPIVDQTLNGDRRNRVTVNPLENSPGTLIITGYVEKQADLSAAKAVLERDTPAHARFRYDVQTKQDRMAILRRRLDGIGLPEPLRIQQLEDGISLFGPSPVGEKMDELIELMKNFNEEFDSRPPLRLTGNDRFLGDSTIELDIRAVVLGDREHIVMHDGESYAEGAIIDKGYRIKTIDTEFIILEKPQKLTAQGEAEGSHFAYFILSRQ